ncbi:MAG: hypothetical protein JW751_23885 [Polyangiaceae bacterium]|nr:hypothetical protein [Polyangiaceae bacterium]
MSRGAAAATPATASLFIVNPLGATTRVSRWFSTHPSIAERVARRLAMTSRRPTGVRRAPTTRRVHDG